VLFRADLEGDGHVDLWVAPADGSTSALRLSAFPGASGDIEPYEVMVTPDRSRVLYIEGTDFWGPRSLWSVPIDGSGPAILLSGAGDWPRIGYRRFDPTGTRVTYRADSDGDNFEELWISPVAGPASESVRLAEFEVEGTWTLQDLDQQHSPNGQHLTFGAFVELDGAREIWTVPIDGSAPPVRRNPVPDAGDASYGWLLASERRPLAAFFGRYAPGGEVGIWAAPADTMAPAVRLDQPVPGEAVSSAKAALKGEAIAYTVLRDGSFVDLWAVERDGGTPPVRLFEQPEPGDGIAGFWIESQGQRVVFSTGVQVWMLHELWETPIEGPATEARRIHPELAPGANATRLRSSIDTYGTLFTGDFDEVADTELWIADEMIFRSDMEWGNLEEWTLVDP
jgi:hypothetical protein